MTNHSFIVSPGSRGKALNSRPCSTLHHRLLSVLLTLALLAAPASSLRAADPAPAGRPASTDAAMIELFKILRNRGPISEEEFNLLNNLAAPSPAQGVPAASAPAAGPPPSSVAGTKAAPAAAAAPTAPLEQRVQQTEQAVDTLGQKVEDTAKRLFKLENLTDDTSSELFEKVLADKWYERLSFGGYTQFRYTASLDNDAEGLNVPADRSVSETESLLIRRGRMKLSGDVSKHVYLYSQIDFAGSVGGTGDLGLQARDLYGDISFDDKQEYRVRAGLSKVPFGWVNMQSSQNRAPMERPDAINSAAEGERDLGAYFMYAPVEVRKRFKELVKSGLKGSGDYGMLTLGGYNGQGLNRSDLNGEFHWLGRLTYPFKFDNGQFFELGVAGYLGDFVPTVGAVNPGTGPITPTFESGGVKDQRVAVSAVWYPQPFGFEAEWNVGRGPRLSDDLTSIDDADLQGGYLMANYRAKTDWGEIFPFVRWQYYDGGRKFGRNAPGTEINEIDVGFEFSPWAEVELALMYTHSFKRTNTRDFPYNTIEDANRLAFQLQWNY
jgi:Phosphate-selective porin O and P